MCGADFPFKVSSLGVPMALSFGDDLRPPGSIPNAPRGTQPRWPVNEPPGGAGATSPAVHRGRSRYAAVAAPPRIRRLRTAAPAL